MPIVIYPDPPAVSGLEWLTIGGLPLNDTTNLAIEAFDAPPPPKRHEWASGADSDGAILVRDPLFENRTVTVRVRVRELANMDACLAKLGDIVDRLEEAERVRGGIPCVWTPAGSSSELTFYCLSGEVTGLPIEKGGADTGWFIERPIIVIRLHCRPFLYGEDVTVSLGATSLPLVTMEIPDVPGDVPAEARLVVTDTETADRRHLEWGVEHLHYDAATALLIDSDSLVTSGFAGTGTTRTGAYDPGAAGNSVIRATLTTTPVAVCGTGNQAHVGTFRVKARIVPVAATSAGSTIYVRLSWREGDGPLRANTWRAYTRTTTAAEFFEADLGVITIPLKLLGTQRWTGQLEAYGATGDTLDVDYIELIPAGEGYGKATADVRLDTPTAFAALDGFDQTAGSLDGKTAAIGGTWTEAGDPDGFDVEATDHVARRTAVSDAGNDPEDGATALLGSDMTDCAAQVDVTLDVIDNEVDMGLMLRYVDQDNYLALRVGFNEDNPSISVRKQIAGDGPNLVLREIPVGPDVNTWVRLRALVTAGGFWAFWVYPQAGLPGAPVASGYDADLATGGVLASGKAGINDSYGAATPAITRDYDNFAAWVPTLPVVVHAGQSAEIRHDTAIREDSTGTYWGDIDTYRGSRFYLQPAGDEDRVSRVAVKLRRNNVDSEPDSVVDDAHSMSVIVTPRYLLPR